MKRSLVLFLLSLLMGNLSFGADETAEEFPPKAISLERYAAMLKRSPFVLPTHEEEEVATTWASDYQIVSILQHQGETIVLAKNVSTDERISIRTQENAQGIRLLKATLSPDPRTVSALIEKGGVEGRIEYDPSILTDAPQIPDSDNPALKSP